MTKADLLQSFKKLNKQARERKAHIEGYPDAATYMLFLLKNVQEVGVPLKAKSKKAKTIPTIHIVDILDKSGSMDGEKIKAANAGINAGLKDLKQGDVNYTYTLCAFSDWKKISFPHVMSNPEKVPTVNIRTDGYTALWDAIGKTFNEMSKFVKTGEKVLVNIYTDGGENDSREFKASAIHNLIENNKKDYTVTFIGTKGDVTIVNQLIGIDMSNTLVYDGTAVGLQKGFAQTRSSRASYTTSVIAGEDVSIGFYKNIK